MKRQRRDNKELDIILNLEVNPNMTVADLQEIAERNSIYKRYFHMSKLTAEGWADAMSISIERHYAYWGLNTPAPNSIINKAKTVSSRIKRCIKALNNMGL
jgi:hypothetical protein